MGKKVDATVLSAIRFGLISFRDQARTETCAVSFVFCCLAPSSCVCELSVVFGRSQKGSTAILCNAMSPPEMGAWTTQSYLERVAVLLLPANVYVI